MKLNYEQFHNYVKEHGITKAKLTEGYSILSSFSFNPPCKDKELYFGISNNNVLSTFDSDTENKNRQFNYSWDYQWLWHAYEGLFEIEEKKFKVGDKVKILSKSIGNSFTSEGLDNRYPNRIGYITKIYGDGSGRDEDNCLVVDDKKDTGHGNFFALQDLEKIEEKKFEVGDRVRVLDERYRNYFTNTDGTGYIIDSAVFDTYRYRKNCLVGRQKDDWAGVLIASQDLEKIEEEKIKKEKMEEEIKDYLLHATATTFSTNYINLPADHITPSTGYTTPPTTGGNDTQDANSRASFIYEFYKKPMAVIKNAFKSKEQKALDYFELDNEQGGLCDEGRREFIDYLYETDKELKKGFLAKIVEAYKEATKK